MCHPPKRDETLHKVGDPREHMEEILAALRVAIDAILNNPFFINAEQEYEVVLRLEEGELVQGEMEHNDAVGEVAENNGQVENLAYRDFIDEDLD